MSYRYERNQNGESDLVIDGFEKGIADSPYGGIANIQNMNIKYYPGVAYVNYKRLAATLSGSFGSPAYITQSPAGIIYFSDGTGRIYKQDALNSSSFTALTGGPSLTGASGLIFWNNYLISFRGTRIDICGDGTGDTGVTSSNWNTASATTGVWPIAGPVNITLTGTIAAGANAGTISTYNDAQGDARAFWNGATGTYNVTFSNITGVFLANLTQGSANFDFSPSMPSTSGTTMSIVGLNSSQHVSFISANDGNLYFCHGNQIGSLSVNSLQTFAKGDMTSFRYNSNALGLPTFETAIWITELRNLLIICGKNKLYPWDRVSFSWTNPVPIGENISKAINILNVVYVLAGNKGNIYISNGYSAELYRKIPDSITGVVDPAFYYGGIMSHRQKLYFQVLAKSSQTNNNVFAGIFSIDPETSSLVMENQNSYGLNNLSSTSAGFLLDNNDITLNYDNYYSAWYNGSGGVDYNNTTLYSSSEALIESDLIPVGTFLQNKTFSSVEFKLDQPLKSSDSISIYARQSLSDTYTLLGTTNTAVLSNIITPIGMQKFQWIQFKVLISCNSVAANSSFVRLREIRIR